MLYMFEFFAVLAVAAILAASPSLLRLLESLFWSGISRGQSAANYGSESATAEDRVLMRREIRRMTHIIEMNRRDKHR